MKEHFTKISEEIKKECHYLSHEKPAVNILFDHLPKCAGRSFKRFLDSNYLWRQTYSISGKTPREDVRRFKDFSKEKRKRYKLVQGHMANELMEDVIGDFVRITVLREPVDRIISHYYFAKGLKSHYLHDKIHRENMTLADYVSKNVSDELCNWYTAHFSGMDITELMKNPEEGLEMAKMNLVSKYTHVGLMESIGDFVEMICEKTKLSPPKTDLHFNKSVRPALNTNQDACDRKIITEVNNLDVRLYEYVKEHLNQI